MTTTISTGSTRPTMICGIRPKERFFFERRCAFCASCPAFLSEGLKFTSRSRISTVANKMVDREYISGLIPLRTSE